MDYQSISSYNTGDRNTRKGRPAPPLPGVVHSEDEPHARCAVGIPAEVVYFRFSSLDAAGAVVVGEATVGAASLGLSVFVGIATR